MQDKKKSTGAFKIFPKLVVFLAVLGCLTTLIARSIDGGKKKRALHLKNQISRNLQIPAQFNPINYFNFDDTSFPTGFVTDLFVQDNVGVYKCPSPGEPPVEIPHKTNAQIEVAGPNTLCSLVLKKITCGGFNALGIQLGSGEKSESLTRIARSYEGNDWEISAGAHISQTFNCTGKLCTTCMERHPTFSAFPFVFYKYELISYEDNREFSSKDAASKFLQQTTFGPTMADLEPWANYNVSNSASYSLSFANWLTDQFDSTPISSHRARFREQANTRARVTKLISTPQQPCSENSAWTSYAFGIKDASTSDADRSITITNTTNDGSNETVYLMYMDNIPRTQVENIAFLDYNTTFEYPLTLVVCEVEELIGGNFALLLDGECRYFLGGNPPISFQSTATPKPDYYITKTSDYFAQFQAMPGRTMNDTYFLESGLDDSSCEFLHIGAFPVMIDFGDGANPRWLSFDGRLELLENDLNNPIPDGGGSQQLLGSRCSNVARNFLNIDTCILSESLEGCSSAYTNPAAEVSLSDITLLKLFELTKNYVYAVKDLRADTSPCEQNTISRWQKIDNITQCINDTIVTDQSTLTTLSNLLLNAGEDSSVYSTESGWLRDIEYSSGSCDKDMTTPNATDRSYVLVLAGDTCWELVHQDLYNVYEMTPWVEQHPGGANQITQFADNLNPFLSFPSNHLMERWDMNKEIFPYIGRYNTTVLFQDLPPSVQQDNVAIEYGAVGSDGGGLIVSCGSPYEVPNDVSKGNTFFSFELDDETDTLDFFELKSQRYAIWADVVLSAQDQLRQRMAWALAQLFAISPDDVGEGEKTEGYLTYYDIFVRNAFGNYFDILKEVSYRSKSSQYMLDTTNFVAFADENYAREIMQLFTIGTVLLDMDGTPKLDPDTGKEILSYTNEQIQSFARAWTGFTTQAQRGNIEVASINREDPMFIIADWRDIFPKVDLFEGYVGDSYPLCEDMPERSFLRKGAEFRLLGSKSALELSANPGDSFNVTLKKLSLDSNSQLYNKLCNPTTSQGTDCNFQSRVILTENLECSDLECDVDTVRQVEVTKDIYFEYVRQPCVELSYFSNPKTITTSNRGLSMCANPNTAVAGVVCCSTGISAGERSCVYEDERVTYDTASQRCSSSGQSTCAFQGLLETTDCLAHNTYLFWYEAICTLRVKILDTGFISIVHRLADPERYKVKNAFSEDTANTFQGYWINGFSPNVCSDSSCEEVDDGCICDVTVENSAVFSAAPSLSELSMLYIGSLSPDTYDTNVYDPPLTVGDYKVYFRSGSSYDIDTIFEIQEGNEVKYYKNMQSIVRISDDYKFRNPPHFMNFVQSDSRDAYHETDAVLKQYLQHPNVPPFISSNFLRRFGMSNPSPRYINAVATAFQNGQYEHQGIIFGSGEFGDLKAMLAAIFLDSEALSRVVEIDPIFGALREPLLKVIAVMRSMEFNKFPEFQGTNTLFDQMTSKIDQMVHEIPTVFSFFLNDFSPLGRISEASLVGPEGTKYLAPYIVGLLNGLLSMVKYGLSSCSQGFGVEGSGECSDGSASAGQGNLTYVPSNPSDAKIVVDELATLLTAGRLNEESRAIINEQFTTADNDVEGLQLAQQYIMTTPEFHTIGNTKFNGEPRPPIPEPSKSSQEFKAVIYLQLFGGLDSYNMIVPHSGCLEKNMYDEYKEVRGNIALDNETLLLVDTGGEKQPCDYFGIHYDLPVVKELYDDGDLLFFMNTGQMNEDVDKSNWRRKTTTALFSHNDQARENQKLDPDDIYPGTGVFGRMADVLTSMGFSTGSISISSQNYLLGGEPQQSPSQMYLDSSGVKEVFPDETELFEEIVGDLNNATSEESGIFGETWSAYLQDSIFSTRLLQEALENATLGNETAFDEVGGLAKSFKVISKAISSKDVLGIDRAFFYVRTGGFDTHSNQEDVLGSRFEHISSVLDVFVQEMKLQQEWKNVVIVLSSDFGRTITPNGGQGTDHAWGGNYFAVGGSVRGGRMLGKYPDDLTNKGPLNTGRGRMIPTTSWDAIFHGVAEWLGIEDEADLNKVIPNRGKFETMYQSFELFG